MNIYQRLAAISKQVGAVKKDERNQAQKFNFRGVDAVTNATYHAFIEHEVVAIPNVVSTEISEITSGNGKRQAWVRLVCEYSFFGPDGDSVTCSVISEATDFADKASAKAMSVAFRIAMLQVLHLPTDEPDPDSEYESRGEAPKPVVAVAKKVAAKKSAPKAAAPVEDVPPWDDAVSDRRNKIIEKLKARRIPPAKANAKAKELGFDTISAIDDFELLNVVDSWIELGDHSD